jgi:hypothetical protein
VFQKYFRQAVGGGGGSVRVIDKIILSESTAGPGARRMAVRRVEREASASRVAKWPKRKCRFEQKYQKIGPFNNGGLRD